MLDGFPPLVPQATAAYELASKRGITLRAVILLEILYAELIDRLVTRSVEDGRSDDNVETIRHRIEVYREADAAAGRLLPGARHPAARRRQRNDQRGDDRDQRRSTTPSETALIRRSGPRADLGELGAISATTASGRHLCQLLSETAPSSPPARRRDQPVMASGRVRMRSAISESGVRDVRGRRFVDEAEWMLPPGRWPVGGCCSRASPAPSEAAARHVRRRDQQLRFLGTQPRLTVLEGHRRRVPSVSLAPRRHSGGVEPEHRAGMHLRGGDVERLVVGWAVSFHPSDGCLEAGRWRRWRS